MSLHQFQEVIDAPEEDYLYVQTSLIPNSGQGLFTAIKIFKNEIIAQFKGEKLIRIEADKRAELGLDQYFIDLPDGRTLDSKYVDCFAKYANDANGSLSQLKNNSVIVLNENDEVCIIATCTIKSGEEIYCSYGKNYWKFRTK